MFNKLKQKVNEEYSNDLTPTHKSLTNGRKASQTSSEPSHSNDESQSIKESTAEKGNKEIRHNGSNDSSPLSAIKNSDSKASTENVADKNQDLKKLNQSLLDHIDVLTVCLILNLSMNDYFPRITSAFMFKE
jgi:hypothetical protein